MDCLVLAGEMMLEGILSYYITTEAALPANN